MLSTMQRSGAHLARVARQSGQIGGVVLLEDLLEELVGAGYRRGPPHRGGAPAVPGGPRPGEGGAPVGLSGPGAQLRGGNSSVRNSCCARSSATLKLSV